MSRLVLMLTISLLSIAAPTEANWPLATAAKAAELKPPSGAPPEITQSAKAYLEECESYGSAPSPTDRYIAAVDLNDDGAPDYLIDTNEMNAPCFCGSGGCTIEAWVSDAGGHKLAYQSNVRGWQVVPKESFPPMLLVDLHGSACGGVGADLCLKALVYRDGKLTDTTAGQ
jgi:hypothetical protein